VEGLLHERCESRFATDCSSDLCMLALDQIVVLTSCSAVVPTALGTASDINLSNASLVFISVTFATMVCCPLKGLIHLCFSS